jgi:hypothetical protein
MVGRREHLPKNREYQLLDRYIVPPSIARMDIRELQGLLDPTWQVLRQPS